MSGARQAPGDGQPAVDLGDLRLFVVLAEELHSGRAAARLHLSQWDGFTHPAGAVSDGAGLRAWVWPDSQADGPMRLDA